jgi:hypothetical protein
MLKQSFLMLTQSLRINPTWFIAVVAIGGHISTHPITLFICCISTVTFSPFPNEYEPVLQGGSLDEVGDQDAKKRISTWK